MHLKSRQVGYNFSISATLKYTSNKTSGLSDCGIPPSPFFAKRAESADSKRVDVGGTRGTSGSSAFLDAGFGRECERALGIFERELRNTRAEHGFESVLGPVEEFAGLAVALLGVLQMRSQSFELVREFFHLLFHPGKAF